MAAIKRTQPRRNRSTAKIVNIGKWRDAHRIVPMEEPMRYPAKLVGFRRFRYWW